MPEQKLTRLEFAAALKRGQGRALLFVRQHGLSEVSDLVLDACLADPVYDRQCEGSRAAWIFQMFQDSGDYGRFSEAIVSALSLFSSEANCYDLKHLCELAALMAKAGDEAAAVALRLRVLTQSLKVSNALCGCRPLVLLDGVPAVIVLARRFGQLLKERSDERPPSVDYLTAGLGIHDDAVKELRRLAETDGDIKHYPESEQDYAVHERESRKESPEERQKAVRENVRQKLTLDGMLNDAYREVGNYPSRYMRFGEYATDDELKIAFLRLIEETQERVCLRLLWIFRRASLPDLHPRTWQLADAKDDVLRGAALQALAQNKDSRIGELGRARLRSGAFTAKDSDTLDLLIRNFCPQDEQLILAALATLSPDVDEAHNLGSSLLDICDANTSCASLGMLKWVYEFTPCTLCRYSSVKQMAVIGEVPQEILAECLDDANEDLRNLAEECKERRVSEYSSL